MIIKILQIAFIAVVSTAFGACSALVTAVPTSLMGKVDSFQLEDMDENRVKLVLHSRENSETESDLKKKYGLRCQYVQDLGFMAILNRNEALGFLMTLADHRTHIRVDEGIATFRGLPTANAKDGSREVSVATDRRRGFMR